MVLEKDNRNRQSEQKQVLNKVETSYDYEAKKSRRVILVDGEGWHPGVVGIVASRLAEIHGRPAVVVSWEGDQGRASGRSVPGFNLFKVIQKVSGSLMKFGGHAQAIGFTVLREKWTDFSAEFIAEMEISYPRNFVKTLEIDCSWPVSQVDRDLIKSLDQLQPFGEANPRPLFISEAVSCEGVNCVGNGQHLKFHVNGVPAIFFGAGDRLAEIKKFRGSFELAYFPFLSSYSRKIELEVADFRSCPVRETSC